MKKAEGRGQKDAIQCGLQIPRQDEEEPAVGKGFEVELGKFWLNEETNKWVRWHELYVRSFLKGERNKSLIVQGENLILDLIVLVPCNTWRKLKRVNGVLYGKRRARNPV